MREKIIRFAVRLGFVSLAGIIILTGSVLSLGAASYYMRRAAPGLNSAVEAAISLLNDLDDVVISSPSNGQVLKYSGGSWVNDTDETASGSAPGSIANGMGLNGNILPNGIVCAGGGGIHAYYRLITHWQSPERVGYMNPNGWIEYSPSGAYVNHSNSAAFTQCIGQPISAATAIN